jgi:cell division cycle 14
MSFSSHSCIELIKDELFITFQRDVSEKKFATNVVYYVNDKSFVYTSFFADFGPLDLGITHKFCDQMKRTVEMAKRAKKPVLYVCSDHPHHRSNSAVLILAYLIFELQLPVETAYAPFIGISPPFFPFRDAGFCINTYPVTVLDCACAMHKAQSLEHYVHSSFSSSGE